MTDAMKLWGRGLAGLMFFAVALSGCSESITNPRTPGSGLLGSDVLIRDTTLVAVFDSVFQLRIPPDSLLFSPTQRNLVGKNGNYTSLGAIRFYPPVRDTISVVSARLSLRIVSRQGDASGTFGFTVHKILSDWDQRKLNWLMANESGFFEAAITRGTYTSTTNPDTQLITIELDTVMVREWYRTGQTAYGIVLSPTSGSNVIRGFSAFDFDSSKHWPKLEVIATDANRTGRFRDTVSFQVGADTYVANADPFPIDTERIYSQAGIVYRSLLKFDISRLPHGTVINTAELLLERDDALSKTFGFSPDPTPVVHANVRADSVLFEPPFATGSLKPNSTSTFSFDVRRQVQLWVNGLNHGLVLRQALANEINTLDIFVFHGSRSNEVAKRPKIVIKYTVFTN